MAKKKLTKNQFVKKVLDLFEKYQETTGAILEDYLTGPDMTAELAAADTNFIDEIEEMEVDDLDTVIELIESMDLDKDKTSQILNQLDEDYVRDYVNGDEDYILIKCSDGNVRRMVEEFLTEKVYPNYNDQRAYLTM